MTQPGRTTVKVAFQNVYWEIVGGADAILKVVVGTGSGKAKQRAVKEKRNYLPVNQCRSKKQQSSPV